MKSKGEKANLDNSDKYTVTDARRLWMVWWNRNQPDLLNLKAKHHAEGQRAFQQLLTESRNQLRTNEATERVARGICRRNWPKNEDFVHYWHWYCDDFRSDARAAITALLGEH